MNALGAIRHTFNVKKATKVAHHDEHEWQMLRNQKQKKQPKKQPQEQAVDEETTVDTQHLSNSNAEEQAKDQQIQSPSLSYSFGHLPTVLHSVFSHGDDMNGLFGGVISNNSNPGVSGANSTKHNILRHHETTLDEYLRSRRSEKRRIQRRKNEQDFKLVFIAAGDLNTFEIVSISILSCVTSCTTLLLLFWIYRHRKTTTAAKSSLSASLL